MEVSIFQKKRNQAANQREQIEISRRMLHIHKYDSFLCQRFIQIKTKSNIYNVNEKLSVVSIFNYEHPFNSFSSSNFRNPRISCFM